jgi:hypothetical protein
VIQVQTDTLANFCASRQIDTIDFIHMDVQGAELKVLAGAGDLISRIKAVWTEVERIPLYAGQPLKSDVERFMEDHAFLKLKDTVGAVSGDQLFVNRALVRVPVRIRAARSAPVVFGLRVGRRVGQMIRVIARRSARLIHPD